MINAVNVYNYSVCRKNVSVSPLGTENYGGMDGFYSITKDIATGLQANISDEIIESFADMAMQRNTTTTPNQLISDIILGQGGGLAFMVLGVLIIFASLVFGTVCCVMRVCCYGRCCGCGEPPPKKASKVKAIVLLVLIVITSIFLLTSTITFNNSVRHLHNSMDSMAEMTDNITTDVKLAVDSGLDEMLCVADKTLNGGLEHIKQMIVTLPSDFVRELHRIIGISDLFNRGLDADIAHMNDGYSKCTVASGNIQNSNDSLCVSFITNLCDSLNSSANNLTTLKAEWRKTNTSLENLTNQTASAAQPLLNILDNAVASFSKIVDDIKKVIRDATAHINIVDEKIYMVEGYIFDSSWYSPVKITFQFLITFVVALALLFALCTVIGLILWLVFSSRAPPVEEQNITATVPATTPDQAASTEATANTPNTMSVEASAEQAPGAGDRIAGGRATYSKSKNVNGSKDEAQEKSGENNKKGKRSPRKLKKFKPSQKDTYVPCCGRCAGVGFYMTICCVWIPMTVAVAVFGLGIIAAGVCGQIFEDPSFRAFEHFYDSLIPPEEYKLSNLSKVMTKIRPSVFFKSCKENNAIASAILLQEQFNNGTIDEIFKPNTLENAMTNIVEGTRMNYSQEAQGASDGGSLLPLNKTSLNGNLTCVNDTVRNDLTAAMDPVFLSVQEIKRQYDYVKKQTSDLLKVGSALYNSLLGLIKKKEADIVRALLITMTNVVYEILTNTFRCGSIYQSYQNIGNLICQRMAKPIHGIWGAAGLAGISMFILAILLLLSTSVLYSPISEVAQKPETLAAGEGEESKINPTTGTGMTTALGSNMTAAQ